MEEENSKELSAVNLTETEKQELEDAWKEIMEDAKDVVDDYAKNPSKLSGSTIRIHEDSPFMDENLKKNEWNKVVKPVVQWGSFKKDKKDKKDDKK